MAELPTRRRDLRIARTLFRMIQLDTTLETERAMAQEKLDVLVKKHSFTEKELKGAVYGIDSGYIELKGPYLPLLNALNRYYSVYLEEELIVMVLRDNRVRVIGAPASTDRFLALFAAIQDQVTEHFETYIRNRPYIPVNYITSVEDGYHLLGKWAFEKQSTGNTGQPNTLPYEEFQAVLAYWISTLSFYVAMIVNDRLKGIKKEQPKLEGEHGPVDTPPTAVTNGQTDLVQRTQVVPKPEADPSVKVEQEEKPSQPIKVTGIVNTNDFYTACGCGRIVVNSHDLFVKGR